MTINVTNNPDGTFTVSCGTESVIVGTPIVATPAPTPNKKKPRPSGPGGIAVAGVAASIVSRPGGIVTANIVDAHAPAGTKHARNAKDLFAQLKSQVSAVSVAGAIVKGKGKPKELHFSLSGQHTIDVSKIAAITGGPDVPHPIITHIHIHKDNA